MFMTCKDKIKPKCEINFEEIKPKWKCFYMSGFKSIFKGLIISFVDTFP